ncbi:MAG: CBS domain-containing protein [Acidobacteriota bacterium]
MATRYSDYERGRFGRSYAEEEDQNYRRRLRDEDGRSSPERGLFNRATDEVRSWLGDEQAERRRRWDERASSQYPYDIYNWRVVDLMTGNPAVVHPKDSIQQAAQVMQKCDCGALPVIDNRGRLIGMITDRDITMRLVARGMNPRQTSVEDCMTDEAFACHANDSLEGCLHTMSQHQVRRIPVVDDRDRLIGIVSQSDIVQHAGNYPGQGERRAIADVLCAISEPTRASYR